ncbi:hypothetical protein CLF_110514 [Clonorchis sinensis]|uniref:Uncharacterized protein n=1 Tax=Clonorchis sinensis TaxID=79923 RepID=G7YKT3_CLOSI|nr:hypothetical protein CLF_110514 [Clonorchis sinensis]
MYFVALSESITFPVIVNAEGNRDMPCNLEAILLKWPKKVRTESGYLRIQTTGLPRRYVLTQTTMAYPEDRVIAHGDLTGSITLLLYLPLQHTLPRDPFSQGFQQPRGLRQSDEFHEGKNRSRAIEDFSKTLEQINSMTQIKVKAPLINLCKRTTVSLNASQLWCTGKRVFDSFLTVKGLIRKYIMVIGNEWTFIPRPKMKILSARSGPVSLTGKNPSTLLWVLGFRTLVATEFHTVPADRGLLVSFGRKIFGFEALEIHFSSLFALQHSNCSDNQISINITLELNRQVRQGETAAETLQHASEALESFPWPVQFQSLSLLGVDFGEIREDWEDWQWNSRASVKRLSRPTDVHSFGGSKRLNVELLISADHLTAFAMYRFRVWPPLYVLFDSASNVTKYDFVQHSQPTEWIPSRLLAPGVAPRTAYLTVIDAHRLKATWQPLSLSEWNGVPGGYIVTAERSDFAISIYNNTMFHELDQDSSPRHDIVEHDRCGVRKFLKVLYDPNQNQLIIGHLQPATNYYVTIQPFSKSPKLPSVVKEQKNDWTLLLGPKIFLSPGDSMPMTTSSKPAMKTWDAVPGLRPLNVTVTEEGKTVRIEWIDSFEAMCNREAPSYEDIRIRSRLCSTQTTAKGKSVIAERPADYLEISSALNWTANATVYSVKWIDTFRRDLTASQFNQITSTKSPRIREISLLKETLMAGFWRRLTPMHLTKSEVIHILRIRAKNRIGFGQFSDPVVVPFVPSKEKTGGRLHLKRILITQEKSEPQMHGRVLFSWLVSNQVLKGLDVKVTLTWFEVNPITHLRLGATASRVLHSPQIKSEHMKHKEVLIAIDKLNVGAVYRFRLRQEPSSSMSMDVTEDYVTAYIIQEDLLMPPSRRPHPPRRWLRSNLADEETREHAPRLECNSAIIVLAWPAYPSSIISNLTSKSGPIYTPPVKNYSLQYAQLPDFVEDTSAYKVTNGSVLEWKEYEPAPQAGDEEQFYVLQPSTAHVFRIAVRTDGGRSPYSEPSAVMRTSINRPCEVPKISSVMLVWTNRTTLLRHYGVWDVPEDKHQSPCQTVQVTWLAISDEAWNGKPLFYQIAYQFWLSSYSVRQVSLVKAAKGQRILRAHLPPLPARTYIELKMIPRSFAGDGDETETILVHTGFGCPWKTKKEGLSLTYMHDESKLDGDESDLAFDAHFHCVSDKSSIQFRCFWKPLDVKLMLGYRLTLIPMGSMSLRDAPTHSKQNGNDSTNHTLFAPPTCTSVLIYSLEERHAKLNAGKPSEWTNEHFNTNIVTWPLRPYFRYKVVLEAVLHFGTAKPHLFPPALSPSQDNTAHCGTGFLCTAQWIPTRPVWLWSEWLTRNSLMLLWTNPAEVNGQVKEYLIVRTCHRSETDGHNSDGTDHHYCYRSWDTVVESGPQHPPTVVSKGLRLALIAIREPPNNQQRLNHTVPVINSPSLLHSAVRLTTNIAAPNFFQAFDRYYQSIRWGKSRLWNTPSKHLTERQPMQQSKVFLEAKNAGRLLKIHKIDLITLGRTILCKDKAFSRENTISQSIPASQYWNLPNPSKEFHIEANMTCLFEVKARTNALWNGGWGPTACWLVSTDSHVPVQAPKAMDGCAFEKLGSKFYARISKFVQILIVNEHGINECTSLSLTDTVQRQRSHSSVGCSRPQRDSLLILIGGRINVSQSASCADSVFTGSRIDAQDRGFRPSFPGRFCSCRSATVVHLKGTSEKTGVALLFRCSARGSMLASARTRREREQPSEEGYSTQQLPEMRKILPEGVCSELKNLLTASPPCVCWVNGEKTVGQALFKQGNSDTTIGSLVGSPFLSLRENADGLFLRRCRMYLNSTFLLFRARSRMVACFRMFHWRISDLQRFRILRNASSSSMPPVVNFLKMVEATFPEDAESLRLIRLRAVFFWDEHRVSLVNFVDKADEIKGQHTVVAMSQWSVNYHLINDMSFVGDDQIQEGRLLAGAVSGGCNDMLSPSALLNDFGGLWSVEVTDQQEVSEVVAGVDLLKCSYEELVIFRMTRETKVDHTEKERIGPAQPDLKPQCITKRCRSGVREDNRDWQGRIPFNNAFWTTRFAVVQGVEATLRLFGFLGILARFDRKEAILFQPTKRAYGAQGSLLPKLLRPIIREQNAYEQIYPAAVSEVYSNERLLNRKLQPDSQVIHISWDLATSGWVSVTQFLLEIRFSCEFMLLLSYTRYSGGHFALPRMQVKSRICVNTTRKFNCHCGISKKGRQSKIMSQVAASFARLGLTSDSPYHTAIQIRVSAASEHYLGEVGPVSNWLIVPLSPSRNILHQRWWFLLLLAFCAISTIIGLGFLFYTSVKRQNLHNSSYFARKFSGHIASDKVPDCCLSFEPCPMTTTHTNINGHRGNEKANSLEFPLLLSERYVQPSAHCMYTSFVGSCPRSPRISELQQSPMEPWVSSPPPWETGTLQTVDLLGLDDSPNNSRHSLELTGEIPDHVLCDSQFGGKIMTRSATHHGVRISPHMQSTVTSEGISVQNFVAFKPCAVMCRISSGQTKCQAFNVMQGQPAGHKLRFDCGASCSRNNHVSENVGPFDLHRKNSTWQEPSPVNTAEHVPTSIRYVFDVPAPSGLCNLELYSQSQDDVVTVHANTQTAHRQCCSTQPEVGHTHKQFYHSESSSREMKSQNLWDGSNVLDRSGVTSQIPEGQHYAILSGQAFSAMLGQTPSCSPSLTEHSLNGLSYGIHLVAKNPEDSNQYLPHIGSWISASEVADSKKLVDQWQIEQIQPTQINETGFTQV